MKATLCIDDAVGERRRALLDSAGRPFRIDLDRWSERGKRARLNEVWWGRATARMGDRGWFVDLDLGDHGVLETGKALTEGQMIPVRIKSEAWAEKGPVLSLADMSPKTPRPDRPGRHAEPPDDAFLSGVELGEAMTGEEARREIDAAIEEASASVAAIPSGGAITLEPTQALTVIDVDASGREGEAGGEFDLVLNLAAADLAARQLALRGIGGLVIVDFVSLPKRQEREAVVERFRECLTMRLGRISNVLEISSLGLCEAAIARRARPLADALAAPADEREALDALRAIESAGQSARGARIHARVSHDAAKWLEADHIGWKEALAGRIGARWTLETGTRSPGRPEVWSE